MDLVVKVCTLSQRLQVFSFMETRRCESLTGKGYKKGYGLVSEVSIAFPLAHVIPVYLPK